MKHGQGLNVPCKCMNPGAEIIRLKKRSEYQFHSSFQAKLLSLQRRPSQRQFSIREKLLCVGQKRMLSSSSNLYSGGQTFKEWVLP